MFDRTIEASVIALHKEIVGGRIAIADGVFPAAAVAILAKGILGGHATSIAALSGGGAAASGAAPEGKVVIAVRYPESAVPKKFRVMENEPLKKMFNAFETIRGRASRFFFNGRQVSATETPHALGLKDLSAIDARD